MNVREKLLEAFSNSSKEYFLLEVDSLSEVELRVFIEMIDESPYSPNEWIDSLIFFKKWLLIQKKTKSIVDQIEYINCCIQGNLNGGKLLTLSDLLKNYLDIFGVL